MATRLFVYRFVSKSIIESTCVLCNEMVAASPKLENLKIAEECHKCAAAELTPPKRPSSAVVPVNITPKCGTNQS